MTHGLSPHFSPKKATKGSPFPPSWLKLEVLSPLGVSFLYRVLSSDASSSATNPQLTV